MVVTGGLDAKVKLWDYYGVCVGEFGLTTWSLDDPGTWFEQTCTSEILDDSAGTSAYGSPTLAGERGAGGGKEVDGSADGSPGQLGPASPAPAPDKGGPQRSAAMQAYQQHREERHVRRVSSDFSKRIYLPSSSAGLNFPTTPGRASTSVAHVLHIADLTDVSRPHTVHSTSRGSRGGGGVGATGISVATSAAFTPSRRLSTSGGPRALHRGASVPTRPQTTAGSFRPMTVPSSGASGAKRPGFGL